MQRVGPVFDDSPFYFATSKPWGMLPAMAYGILGGLLAPSLALLLLFVTYGRPSGANLTPYAASIVYFASLGFGFIVVELALLQHLTLLVGHPIFTLSVLLFTLLASGGIGSAISSRVPIRAACAAIAVIGALEAIALPQLLPLLLPLPLAGRVVVAAVFIAPLGVLMGMPFPRGLRGTGKAGLPAPPFYWALNGILSVIGSVATVFIALMAGFQVAMLVGCAFYLFAAVSSKRAFAS
jgi:hypothetical protein